MINLNNFNNKQKEMVAILLILILIAVMCVCSSCNVTRTITTTAQHIQSGDTTTTIVTKTIESYDGNVDAAKFIKVKP